MCSSLFKLALAFRVVDGVLGFLAVGHFLARGEIGGQLVVLLGEVAILALACCSRRV